VPSRCVCHIRASSLSLSQKTCNSRTIAPDSGTPRRAAACMKKTCLGTHPRTRGTGPSHIPYRRAGEAPATPKPWRPASCGDASRDPKACRPTSPAPLPKSAAARAPPRASRKRAQIDARLVEFAVRLLCRCPTTAANPWPPRVGDAHRAVRNTYPKETPCARGGQQDACRPPS
jgi:hypothetical protein